LLDPGRVVQIGIRGTAYNTEDVEWGLSQGVRIIRIEELFDRGIADVMAEAREYRRRCVDLLFLRYRFHRPELCPRHRHAGNRRCYILSGAAGRARTVRGESGRG
jgi:hypothetical protein